MTEYGDRIVKNRRRKGAGLEAEMKVDCTGRGGDERGQRREQLGRIGKRLMLNLHPRQSGLANVIIDAGATAPHTKDRSVVQRRHRRENNKGQVTSSISRRPKVLFGSHRLERA